jgi:hypothetical protein
MGEITELDCQTHVTTYSFDVDGVAYSGGLTDFKGSCLDVKRGQRIRVYYDKNQPATNIATFDNQRQRDRGVSGLLQDVINVLLLIVFIGLPFVIIVAFLAVRYYRRHLVPRRVEGVRVAFARAHLTVPPSLIARADEMIECQLVCGQKLLQVLRSLPVTGFGCRPHH